MLLFNNNLDLNSIIFHKPIYNKLEELYFVKLTDTEHQNCLITTPRFKVHGIQKCVLELEFVAECNQFYQDLRTFDNFLIHKIATSGEHLFDVNLEQNSVKDLYKLSPKIPNFIPKLPIILVFIENGCQLVNKNGQQIPFHELKHNQHIHFDLNIDGVYFEKSKCYAIYKTNKIQLIDEVIKNQIHQNHLLSNHSTSSSHSASNKKKSPTLEVVHSVLSVDNEIVDNLSQNDGNKTQCVNICINQCESPNASPSASPNASPLDSENYQSEQKLPANDDNSSSEEKLISEYLTLVSEIVEKNQKQNKSIVSIDEELSETSNDVDPKELTQEQINVLNNIYESEINDLTLSVV